MLLRLETWELETVAVNDSCEEKWKSLQDQTRQNSVAHSRALERVTIDLHLSHQPLPEGKTAKTSLDCFPQFKPPREAVWTHVSEQASSTADDFFEVTVSLIVAVFMQGISQANLKQTCLQCGFPTEASRAWVEISCGIMPMC